MKPKKLVMSAFGSYSGVETIDFEQMDHGLFLIAGDTGAGKSTIFDAIMFALYDTMSGKERKGNMMRSEYAADSAETFVEYTFAYGSASKQDIYVIKRFPSYERKSRRKNKDGEYGMTKQLGRVSLIMPDGREFYGKAAEINRKIQEIVGLTAEQFSKIAMIAQGEFQELIMDKTGRRKEIFQQIFSTELYEKIEKKILERYKASLSAVKENTTKLREALGGISVADNEKERWDEALRFVETEPERVHAFLEEKVKGEKKECSRRKKELEEAQALFAKKNEEYQEALRLNELLEEYRKALEEKDGLARREQEIEGLEREFVLAKAAKEVQPFCQNYLWLEKDAAQAEKMREEYKALESRWKKESEDAGKLRDRWQERYGKRQPEILQEQGRLEEELKIWDGLSECQKKIKNLRQQITKRKNALRKKQEERERLVSVKEQLERWLEENSRLELLSEQVQRRIEEIQEKTGRLKRYGARWEEMAQKKEEAQDCEGMLLKAVRKWEKARREHEEKNHAYIAAQSSFLAMELADGMPCPVCGSVHHPSPAEPAKDTVTKKVLEDAQKREQRCQEEKERCQLDFEAVKTAWKEMEKAMLSDGRELFAKECVLEEIPHCLEEVFREQEEMLKDAGKECGRLKGLLEEKDAKKQELADTARAILSLEDGQDAAKEKLQQADGELKALEAKEKIWAEKVTIRSAKDGMEMLESLASELQMLQKEGKKLERAAAKSQKEYDTLLGNRDENERQIVRILADLGESKERYQEMLVKQGFTGEEDFQSAVLLIEGQEERQNRIEQYRLRKAKCEEKAGMLEKQTHGKNKIEIAGLEEGRRAIKERLDGLQREYEAGSYRYQGNHKILKRVAELLQGKASLMEDMRVVRSLNDAANGKVHFQTYILRQYFKQIIQAANKRLAKMTGEQFLLKCRELTGTGQGEAGLDLDVYNPVTGKSRDARTLSGGETFLASLSMALGMADVVQRTAGKTHLDTMFIDEGFGSLSEEVRGTAVRVLLELAGDWRLVGVISHVSELKEQIPNKLIVTKGNHGSGVKWVQD